MLKAQPEMPTGVTRGLVIREPWIGMILRGEKTWELRSKNTSMRGPIALIRAGSGQVVGTAVLARTLPALTAANFAGYRAQHGVPEAQQAEALATGWVVPWVLEQVQPLDPPLPYRHPSGAVTWVVLEPDVVAALAGPGRIEKPAADETSRSTAVRSTVAAVADGAGAVRIRLTGGNVRNFHIYLRSAAHLLPAAAIGGRNAGEAAREQMTVVFDPGPTVQTDIDGEKMIFRARGAVRDFFIRSGAQEGDEVLIHRTSPLDLHVRLVARQ